MLLAPLHGQKPAVAVTLTLVDETGVTVPGALVIVSSPGNENLQLRSDFAGRCHFEISPSAPYQIHAEKPGFYEANAKEIDPAESTLRVVLAHQQMVREQVNVAASPPGIDPEQVADEKVMNTAEIVNIPYPTSRDIRRLLPFNPGVVQDATGQIHVQGSETWETLDTLDGFDIRSPVSGLLAMRVSADAVRSVDQASTRYPVEYGRATGGVVAFYTGMGDNQYRFNATNFIPSFRDLNGIRFDKFVPRFTFSGPIRRDHAWWDDGVDFEYDNIYIQELPANADTNQVIRGSNLIKAQANLRPDNIVTGGLLFNDYHSSYDGLSALTPQLSTTKRDTISWLGYVRDQWNFRRGALLDLGVGNTRIRDGFEPHGNTPYQSTPDTAEGSYFENLAGHSQRWQGTLALYLTPHHLAGQHDLRLGLDVDRVGYNQKQTLAPISYLREDGTLDRQSVFTPARPFTIRNDEIGAYIEDRWRPKPKLLIEPGLRFDWDSLVRSPLPAPRLAAVWTAPGASSTKISAGAGLYYDHTQLQYMVQPHTGARFDTYYATDGITPLGPASLTTFSVNRNLLYEPRTINWSVALERKLPWSIFGGVSYIQKSTAHQFIFANQSGPAAMAGNYLLSNARADHYHAEEFDLRRTFADGYTVFVAYTRSSAHTNAALNYLPTPSPLGAQQSGPLAWNVPNRTISWGWLPVPLAFLQKRWDFVYTVDWHTGYPYTAVNAAGQVVGLAGAYRFPAYLNFSPGLEWRFHFRGQYYGLRGVMENALGRANPLIVNSNIDSPAFGTVSQAAGRSLTARIRLIGAK